MEAVLNENIPDKVFENVNLHSSMESLDKNKADGELAESVVEKLPKSKTNSLRRFFSKKTDEPSEPASEDAKQEKLKLGAIARKIYSKSTKASSDVSTVPKREHGQMNLVEDSELDGVPKQRSLTNLKSTVSLYWQSIFSKKRLDEQESNELIKDNEAKKNLTENTEKSEAAEILINN